MTYGFLPPYPQRFEPWQNLPDGRNWRLLEPLLFRRRNGTLVRAATGTLTDGISTPREIWQLIAPFDYWLCGVLHDALYKDTTEVYDPATEAWVKFTVPTHEDADDIMNEALESRGCGVLEREAIVRALKALGEQAFREDRTGTPQPAAVKA